MDGCHSTLFPGIFSEFRTSVKISPKISGILTNAGAGLKDTSPGHTSREVIRMNSKRHQQRLCEDLRLDPEARLCPAFDCTSIKLFAAPDAGEMGMRVLDNCAEENIK